MPEPEDQRKTGGSPDDLLESLLVSAAERAAKREAQEALEKGFVTRKDINLALDTFGQTLEDRISQRIVESVKEALMPQVEEVVMKAAGSRKSTIMTPEEEREADPVAYILKKARELGPEAFDETDKRIVWGLTYEGLGRGLSNDNREAD